MKRGFQSGIVGKVNRLAILGLTLVQMAVLSNCGKSQPPPPPLTISPSSLPNLSTGDAIQLPLKVSGGVAPYNWGVSSGSLPHGLSLSTIPSGAVISGIPDTAVQAATFTLQVTDSSDGSGSQRYTVSVLIGADRLTLSPSVLNFGPQVLTTLSGTQTVTVTNAILSPITISQVAISGDDTEFGTNQTCDTTLAGGDSCTITALFIPAQVGPRTATITLTDDTLGSPHSIALNGIGIVTGANATFSAASISFGSVAVGDTSQAQSVTLTNYGTSTLNVTSLTASPGFAETDDCNVPIQPEASCSVNVTFNPTSTGSISGTLTVASSGTDSPQNVSLSGSGVAGSCQSKGMGCGVVFRCCPGLKCTVTDQQGHAVCQ